MKIASLLILAGVLSRFLSLPHGLSLTAAVILLAGVYLPWRQVLIVALATMAIGDAVKGFHQLIPWTWTGALWMGVAALSLRKRASYSRIALVSIGASTIYYLWCEFGMWVMGNCLPGERIYPASLAGLLGVYQSGFNHYLYRLAGNLGITLTLFAIAKSFARTAVPIKQAPDPSTGWVSRGHSVSR